jgi:hypothetical protein
MRNGREARRRRQSGALDRLRNDLVWWFNYKLNLEQSEQQVRRIQKEIATLEARLGLVEVK